ncbi:hypothetical protein Golob_007172, partial [Gossypium lobatum]|nr:hypothetical protein [Gossypium lobatum]
DEFWVFYLKQYSKPATRLWHFAGTLSCIVLFMYAVRLSGGSWCLCQYAVIHVPGTVISLWKGTFPSLLGIHFGPFYAILRC